MRTLLVWVAVVALAGGWEVTFSPHPDNKAIQLVTECREGNQLVFFSVNVRDVEATSTRVWFPRPEGPQRGCIHEIEVVRWDGDDPTYAYAAERYVIP